MGAGLTAGTELGLSSPTVQPCVLQFSIDLIGSAILCLGSTPIAINASVSVSGLLPVSVLELKLIKK